MEDNNTKIKKCRGENPDENKYDKEKSLPCNEDDIVKNVKTVNQCCEKQNIKVDLLNSGSSGFQISTLCNASLAYALKLFGLSDLLIKLDSDLEKVKKGEKSKEDHEIYFGENVNCIFEELSSKHHPNNIKRKGGSEEELARAEDIHKNIVSIWSVMNMLYDNFIAKNFLSHQNFEYNSCSNIELGLLIDEEILFNLSEKVLEKLILLSKTKCKDLKSNLSKFLNHSRSSINSFICKDVRSFENNKRSAWICFNAYLHGHEKLVKTLSFMQAECGTEDNLACIMPTVKRLLVDSQEQLTILKELKLLSMSSFNFYCKYCHGYTNKGLSLPFLEYLCLLCKCKEIITKNEQNIKLETNGFYYKRRYSNSHPAEHFDTVRQKIKAVEVGKIHYDLLCSLVDYYCSERRKNRERINTILERYFDIRIQLKDEVLEILFACIVEIYGKYLEEKFRCMELMFEHDIKNFEYTVENVSETFSCGLQQITRKTLREIKEQKYKITEDINQINKKLEDSIDEMEEEITSKMRQIEENLKSEELKNKEIYKVLRKQEEERERMEEEIRQEIATTAKSDEEKLREQCQNAEKEMTDNITKALKEIMDLTDGLEDFIALENKVNLSE